MMKVEAVIRCEKLEVVKRALSSEGFQGMTVYKVRGRGRQKGYVLNFRGRSINVDLLPKLKIELIVDDSDIERVVQTIRDNALTNEIGDGKIFVYPVAQVIRIRTAERGKEAM